MKKKLLIIIPVLLILFSVLFAQTGRPVRLWDTNSSNVTTIVWNENDTSNRTLNLTLNSGNRTFALHGNLTVESTSLINQDLTTDASPSYANLSLGTGELTAGSINRASGTLTLEIGGTPEISITTTATTFGGNIIVADGATIGNGVLLTFDDSNNFLEITGAKVGIGTATPQHELEVAGASATIRITDFNSDGTAAIEFLEFWDNDSQQGVVGFGSAANSDMDIQNLEVGGNLDFNTDGAFNFTGEAIISIQNSDTLTITGDGTDFTFDNSDANINFADSIDLIGNSLLGTSVDINNAELQQISAIGATTISGTQWGYLGATGAGGGQLLAAITTGESTQIEAIGAVTINVTQWGYLGASDQGISTGTAVTFATLDTGQGANELYDMDQNVLQASTGVNFASLGINTATVPHGGVGMARLGIDGTDDSDAGPHVQFTTALDDYPLLQIAPIAHDSILIMFDAYFKKSVATNFSSDAGSNYRLLKASDLFKIQYDSGVAQGNAVSFNDGIVLDTSGLVTIAGGINLSANSITGTSVDINNAELQQISAIGATTISGTQWGYLGATGAGGGQLLAAITTGESTQIEAIGAVTINVTQWGYLGASDQGFSTGLSPTYVGATFSGLTASLPVVTTAGKALASVAYATFKASLVIAQADVSGLTTGDSPVFVTAKLSGLTDGYIPYHVADATGLADSVIFTDGTGVGINTVTIPHGGIGAAKFAIDGTDSSTAGPHMQFTTATDNYPLLQIQNWTHDNISIMFDSYTDGSEKSSDSGSNFKIHKNGNQLVWRYDSGIANGNAITWNAGLGMNVSGVIQMHVYGVGTATFSAAGIISSVSDIRLKRDVRDFNTGLDSLDNIQPIYYKWNEESGMLGRDGKLDDYEYVGFSAQNVEKTIPEAVGQNAAGMKSFSDRAIIAVLVNSIKEQQTQIETLEARIEQLENLILRRIK